MARIAPATRISRSGRFVERPRQVIQTVSTPTPTPQLTSEQIAQQEREFYSKRGIEQSTQLATKIKSEQAKVERYREQVAKATSSRTMESAENRLIRAEETLGAYQSMKGKASSGKYRYVDLISAAQAEGIYKLEVQTYKPPIPEALVRYNPKTKRMELMSPEGYRRVRGLPPEDKYGRPLYTPQQWEKIKMETEAPPDPSYKADVTAWRKVPLKERIPFEDWRSQQKAPQQYFGSTIKLPGETFTFDYTPDRTGQIYFPDVDAYVKPTYQWGAGGTAIFSPPTLKESEVISAAQYKGDILSLYSKGFAPVVFAKDIITPKVKKTEDIIFRGTKALIGTEIKIPIFGLGTPTGVPGDKVGMKDVKKGLGEEFGVTGKVAGIFLPETYGELAVMTAAPLAYKSIPPIAKIGVSTYFGVTGTKAAFDPTKTKAERIAGGIVGALGITGAAFEGYPYVKGAFYKFSPKYKPVVTQPKGYKAVSTKDPIGLIKPAAPLKTRATIDVKLPLTSALKRGGFGVKPGEKYLYLGDYQKLATSQRGFFRTGRDIVLTREFFVTPQDPTLLIATARLSRLGLTSPWKTTPSATLGWGWPKTAQIGVTPGTVTRTGVRGTWRLGLGTELEAIKGAGTVISGVEKTGVTTIWGQAVDLFKFKTTPSPVVRGIPSVPLPTTAPTTITSGYGFLSTFLGVPSREPSVPTKPITVSIPPIISTIPTTPISIPITIPTTKPTIISLSISSLSPPPSIPPLTIISPLPSPPTTILSPLISTIIIPPFSPPTTTKTPPISQPFLLPKRLPIIFWGAKKPREEKPQQGWMPQAKSKGKWLDLARQPMTRSSALGRMSRTIDFTLSAQGRIRKVKGKISPSYDNYFAKSKHKLRPYRIRKGVPIKMHDRFIEKRKFRADTLSEQKGLRVAKMAKNMGWLISSKLRKKRKSGAKRKTKKKSPWLF